MIMMKGMPCNIEVWRGPHDCLSATNARYKIMNISI